MFYSYTAATSADPYLAAAAAAAVGPITYGVSLGITLGRTTSSRPLVLKGLTVTLCGVSRELYTEEDITDLARIEKSNSASCYKYLGEEPFQRVRRQYARR